MVRPRLVEEGVPIGSTLKEGEGSSHNSDPGTMDHEPTSPNTGQPRPSLPCATVFSEQQQPQSSLLRASGGRVASSRKPNHRIVIGGGGDAAAPTSDWRDHPKKNAAEQRVHPFPYDAPQRHYSTHTPLPTPSVPSSSIIEPHHLPHSERSPYHSSSASPTYQPNHPRPTRTHIEIGADTRETEKMQGVEDHSVKAPLVVLDGANVAYAYSQTVMEQSPNVRGIRVAVDYFLQADLRVLVVLPMSWMNRKPGSYHNNVVEQQEILQDLKVRGLLVAAPPTDDDDAYAIMIAQKETRSPAYILSNDLFRDAQQRHSDLSDYLNNTNDNRGALGSGRISYAFCKFGRMDDHGDEELDIVPNPRHPLILWIEGHRRQRR